MEQNLISFSCGAETEDILQAFLAEISDETLSEIEIEREIADTSGLASEPITIAITLTASSVVIVHLTRLLERWLENRRREKSEKLLITAFQTSTEAGNALLELQKKHGDVSISYTLSQEKNDSK